MIEKGSVGAIQHCLFVYANLRFIALLAEEIIKIEMIYFRAFNYILSKSIVV